MIRDYLERSIEEARDRGWSQTITGRRRYLPDLRSKNQTVRQGAERIAMNTPIQGSAADIIKLAMLNIDAMLPNEFPDSRMLLQVHDELVFETPKDKAEELSQRIRLEMERVIPLAVPLVATVSSGLSWAEIH